MHQRNSIRCRMQSLEVRIIAVMNHDVREIIQTLSINSCTTYDAWVELRTEDKSLMNDFSSVIWDIIANKYILYHDYHRAELFCEVLTVTFVVNVRVGILEIR